MTDPTVVALPTANHVSQATTIEQSRAVAEVYAAVMVARQNPRDVQRALSNMRQVCNMTALAERAFFRFPRAGGSVNGPSVHLARELARCWGNIQTDVKELSRDLDKGESEMQAVAWDLETNTRVALSFIMPHGRDTDGGVRKLVSLRDIYESNANHGSRRMRQAIFAVLPTWYVEEAKALCLATVERGPTTEDGKPARSLPQRIADMIAAFEPLGVTEDDMVRKLGRATSKWTAHDVATLRVVYTSLKQGTITRDEEFPPARTTADEIRERATARPAEPAARDWEAGSSPGRLNAADPPPLEQPVVPAPDQPPADPDVEPSRQQQLTAIAALLTEHGVKDRDVRLEVVSRALGEPVGSMKTLTAAEADTVLARLRGWRDVGQLDQTITDARNIVRSDNDG